MGARNRVGIGLSYGRRATKAGGIHSLESIPGLHKSLKFLAHVTASEGRSVLGGGGGYSVDL
jgi:hypothetical protein